jgi:serine/threonine protein kinase
MNYKVANRYQIIETLGKGGMGTTYAAKIEKNSQLVALKKVTLKEAKDWKTLELFEREARVLESLSHPNIPQYFDYFEIDTNEDREFYLVRELIEGIPLAEYIRQKISTELEVIKLALSILDVLIYLHSFSPPIVHRDIKPENIIYQNDGNIYLVDFGAVQDVLRRKESFVSTFVGTLGYMSPEQLRGVVSPASDIYSLGCTLLFLLSKKPPTQFPVSRLKINFRSSVRVSESFANWLDKLIEPAIEDRFNSAIETKRELLKIKNSFNPKFKIPFKQSLSQQSKKNVIAFSKLESSYILEVGSTIYFKCYDTHDFRPSTLTIVEENFMLELNCSNIIHSVRGLAKNLSVFVVKKEGNSPSDDLFAVIAYNDTHYKFAFNLSWQDKVVTVDTIKKYLQNKQL